jgi:hypothetical protein
MVDVIMLITVQTVDNLWAVVSAGINKLSMRSLPGGICVTLTRGSQTAFGNAISYTTTQSSYNCNALAASGSTQISDFFALPNQLQRRTMGHQYLSSPCRIDAAQSCPLSINVLLQTGCDARDVPHLLTSSALI